MAQVAASTVARVAFTNCFTVPTFSVTAILSIHPGLPHFKTLCGQSFTLRYQRGQLTFTKLVRSRNWLLAADETAA